MTELEKKLSYLLDEYPGENSDAALDEVVADVNLQYSMRRYQMIGEAMRHELPANINTGFHSEVMAKVREQGPVVVEPEVQKDTSKSASILSWINLKPLAGLAVAASVAIVTIVLWQPVNDPDGIQSDAVATADQQQIEQLAGQQVKGGAVPASLGMRWKVENDAPGLQQKLNGYLVNHTEYSNSMQGLIPQARVAGFDAQQ
jgi:sigma-E factor negative regulatory protein RseA